MKRIHRVQILVYRGFGAGEKWQNKTGPETWQYRTNQKNVHRTWAKTLGLGKTWEENWRPNIKKLEIGFVDRIHILCDQISNDQNKKIKLSKPTLRTIPQRGYCWASAPNSSLCHAQEINNQTRNGGKAPPGPPGPCGGSTRRWPLPAGSGAGGPGSGGPPRAAGQQAPAPDGRGR